MELKKWIVRILTVALIIFATVEAVIITNLARLNSQQYERNVLNSKSRVASFEGENLFKLRREALTRATLYNELIKHNMLIDGMVVHRKGTGEPEGLCDSLMFSAIRFYALSKMGFHESASQSWNSILGSRIGEQWVRHPRCHESLSRDMVVGVLVALSANPEGGNQVFRSMLQEIDRHWGFIGTGPVYVSWLTPGISGLIRMEAQRRQIPFEEWPWILKQSFSSIEIDGMFLEEGYVSHLAGMGLWLEMTQAQNKDFNPRSIFGQMQRLISSSKTFDTPMDHQRRQWIAGKLTSISTLNIFYEWLDITSRGELTAAHETKMLSELLSMPQFPSARLPMDCDRDADYMWQRRDGEAIPLAQTCGATYHGVDFLWMAALLGVSNDDFEHSSLPEKNQDLAH